MKTVIFSVMYCTAGTKQLQLFDSGLETTIVSGSQGSDKISKY